MDNQQERSLAWLAGIVDGEGSISVQCVTRKSGNVVLVPFVCVVNSDDGILDEVKRVVTELGIKWRCYNIRASTHPASFESRRQCFSFRIDGQQPIADLLARLLPYLRSSAKRNSAEYVLKFIASRRMRLIERNAKGQIHRATYTRQEVEFASAARARVNKRAKSSEAICQAPNVIG